MFESLHASQFDRPCWFGSEIVTLTHAGSIPVDRPINLTLRDCLLQTGSDRPESVPSRTGSAFVYYFDLESVSRFVRNDTNY